MSNEFSNQAKKASYMIRQQAQQTVDEVLSKPVKEEVKEVKKEAKEVVEVKPHHKCDDWVATIGKTDGVDEAYFWMRSFTPSWMVGLMLAIGALVILNNVLKRFGIQLITRVQQK